MDYFYYIDNKKDAPKQFAYVREFYPNAEITPIDSESSDLDASLKVFPETLLINGYKNHKPCTIILDSPEDLANNELFLDIYCKLIDFNVSLSFYRYPYLDTENIISLCKQIQKNRINDEQLKVVVSHLYNIYLGNASLLKKAKSASLRYTKSQGMQVGRTRGKKANIEKRNKVKEFITTHSEDFNGNLSDVDLLEQLQKEEFAVSRNTYYLIKKELKAESE